jgi:hypothetical protein
MPRSKTEIEVDACRGILTATEQHFNALDRWWPRSKRGGNAAKALDRLKEAIKVATTCCDDALIAIKNEQNATSHS